MDTTLQAYEAGSERFVERTGALNRQTEEWIRAAVDPLLKTASILEIGSASGRDATFMESLGYQVQRTDGAQAFVDRLNTQGFDARQLNVVTDELGGPWDAIYASAVFVHLTVDQFRTVLQKARAALRPGGTFAFSVKEGNGDEWESGKLDQARFYHYWQADAIQAELDAVGFGPTTIIRGEISGTVVAEPHHWLRVTTHSPERIEAKR